jgi:hypothetical protein
MKRSGSTTWNGGLREGKGAVSTEKVEECLTTPGTLAVCIREVQKSLMQSSKRLIESKIQQLRVGSTFKILHDRIITPGDGLLNLNQRFILRKVWCDPFQMASTVQRLTKQHIPIEEFPQTVPNLTAATQNLFDLIQSRGIALYPDDAMRLAVSRAIIVESSRGWRLDKLKQHHKIDVVVALSMACLAAVRGSEEHFYPHWSSPVSQAAWGDGPSLDAPPVSPEEQTRIDKANLERARFRAHIFNVTGHLV